jgi:predicted TIM-barrel fold metal-dependent hydrolase
MQAIDAHVHLVPSSKVFQREAKRNGAKYSLDGLLAEMDENDVDRALLIGHWDMDDGSLDGPFRNRTNNELLMVLDEGGDRFRGLLTANVRGHGVIDLDVLDEHLARPEVVGLKFFLGYEAFYPTDLRCEPAYELLERHGKAAVFHTGDTLVSDVQLKYAHPMPLDDVAVAHPELPIVIAHAGQHWMHDAGELVGKNPNVWADLSGWFLGKDLPWFTDYVRTQFREFIFWAEGTDHLMFGTDWPLMRMRPYHEFMRGCDFLPDDVVPKLMRENAERLYWR